MGGCPRNKRQGGSFAFWRIDSPVAGYMVAKEGELCAVHFYSYPYTSERARKSFVPCENPRVLRFAGLYRPFTDIQLEINRKCPNEQLTIIMRRMMMYIANEIATKQAHWRL